MHSYRDFRHEDDMHEIDTIIRQAEPNDARALIGLTQQVGKETNYLTFGSEGVGLTVAQEMDLIHTFATSETNLMLVVEVDDQIIGMGNLATFGSQKQAHVAEIGLSLIQEYWGYGIGGLLMEDLLDFGRQVGLKVITLEVVKDNRRAVKLYERFGFEIVGTLKQRLKYNCNYYDSYVMELLL
ncbi:N-acetyltransferase family protein [Fundicoccus sp. Sow4_F4]|uniref:GNAT family N-acetyltransferase n=2 Tax=unclassified Fundicoccus TaxID=2761543 RepID=UPI003F8E36C4